MIRSRVKKDFVKTAINNDIESAKYLDAMYHDEILPVVGLALSRAGSVGHEVYVKWIIESFPQRLTKEYIQNTQMIVTLCYSGHIQLFEWFLEMFYNTKEDINTFPFYVTFIVVCKRNKLKLLDIICNILNPFRYDLPFIEGLHIAARDRYEIFRYIIENFNICASDINEELIMTLCESNSDMIDHMNHIMAAESAASDQIRTIKWVLNRFNLKFCRSSDVDNMKLFSTILRSGNIDLAEFFISEFEKNREGAYIINISEKAWKQLLCDLCVFNYLDMAQWVVQKYAPPPLSAASSNTDKYVFRICLEAKSLKPVLWFVDRFNLPQMRKRCEAHYITSNATRRAWPKTAMRVLVALAAACGDGSGAATTTNNTPALLELIQWFIEFYDLLSICIIPKKEVNLAYSINITDEYLGILCKDRCLVVLELFINEYGLDKHRCLMICTKHQYLNSGQDLVDYMHFTNQDIAEFIDLLPPFE